MEEPQTPCWYYEKEELRNTPSLSDGIDPATESRYRSEGARFIIECGNKLGLRYDTCATGVVFFHRFYMFHSFKDFPRYVTAACCLFLAGKVEETPKKCRDIVKTARLLLTDHHFSQFGGDPREEVMTIERVLLKTIKFDLQVSHPYKYLLQYVKKAKAGNKEKIENLAQMAWTFINDSLCTTLCLQWEPEIVACAILYLTTRMTKYDIEDWEGKTSGQRWWECFVEGMSIEVMEDICHQILDLYPDSKMSGGMPSGSAPGSMPTTFRSTNQNSPTDTTTPSSANLTPKQQPTTPANGGTGGPPESGTKQQSTQRATSVARQMEQPASGGGAAIATVIQPQQQTVAQQQQATAMSLSTSIPTVGTSLANVYNMAAASMGLGGPGGPPGTVPPVYAPQAPLYDPAAAAAAAAAMMVAQTTGYPPPPTAAGATTAAAAAAYYGAQGSAQATNPYAAQAAPPWYMPQAAPSVYPPPAAGTIMPPPPYMGHM